MEDLDRELFEEKLRLVTSRIFRDRTDPKDTLNDRDFRMTYRFSRRGFYKLVDILKDDLSLPTSRSKALLPAQRLEVVVLALSTNSFQSVVGKVVNCSQSSVSRICYEICQKIAARAIEFICWSSDRERANIAQEFLAIGGIPGVVGCVDGTHVRIPTPSVNEHLFVNRVTPERAAILITASLCLRNAAIDLKEQPFEGDDYTEDYDENDAALPNTPGGDAMMNFVMRKYFS
ncbi:hypothetical protein OESDEN_05250 [Oesophagostomum dentatum]|uniref:Harbinger transposase-derived nuclease n=1 Tax=Oesophagostomum dentatum TaxID=61180 RepID=A0A0B1TC12_OESDE|nr:hypothetical protein OESDEN_05250 [Oesophagostomum dentatum]